MKQALANAGVEQKHLSMRANQLWNAMYVQGVTGFDGITTLAKPLRNEFSDVFDMARPEVTAAQVSKDGTRKWLIKFGPGVEIETVFIPDEDRGTLCISSQVGCTLNCRFCHTGTMRLVRNLTPGEIVGQVMLARDALGEWPRAGQADLAALGDDLVDDDGGYSADGRLLTNIVMMGMGEPLYNFDAVRDALQKQTPIPFDRHNPEYSFWLKQGYEQAREAIASAHDYPSYYYPIARYVNGFHDPHIQLSPTATLPPGAQRWPNSWLPLCPRTSRRAGRSARATRGRRP